MVILVLNTNMLLTMQTNKGQFHCNECGICRLAYLYLSFLCWSYAFSFKLNHCCLDIWLSELVVATTSSIVRSAVRTLFFILDLLCNFVT